MEVVMRKFLMVGVAVAALGLGGCAGGVSPGGSGDDSTVTKIQNTATSICGFLPAAQMVANILASGNAMVSTVSDIAAAICSAATKKSAARGARPTVYGVALQGRFVR